MYGEHMTTPPHTTSLTEAIALFDEWRRDASGLVHTLDAYPTASALAAGREQAYLEVIDHLRSIDTAEPVQR